MEKTKKLNAKQKLAATLMATGMKQSDVAVKIDTTQQNLSVWKKIKEFDSFLEEEKLKNVKALRDKAIHTQGKAFDALLVGLEIAVQAQDLNAIASLTKAIISVSGNRIAGHEETQKVEISHNEKYTDARLQQLMKLHEEDH